MRGTYLAKTAQIDWRAVGRASSCNTFAIATLSTFYLICKAVPDYSVCAIGTVPAAYDNISVTVT